MLLIKIKQQDLLHDGINISGSLACLREYTGCPKKKYTSLKSYIFVLRTNKSLNVVSFVRQDLNLNFES